jgi:glucose/arabinose dehydrogenase
MVDGRKLGGIAQQRRLSRRLRFGSILLGLVLLLQGCGNGGNGETPAPPTAVAQENRIDVTVVGLPSGADAAIAISDSTGRIVATLTSPGPVVVNGPGAFTVSANPVIVASLTYVPTMAPVTISVPTPPSTTPVSVIYAAAPPLRLRFEAVTTGLAAPTFLASAPGSGDLYVVEQPGRIRKLVDGTPQTPIIDISARVASGGERGMLSLAFDPGFASNGYVYVYFTETSGDIAVERFTFPLASNGSPSGVEATAVRVLTISHRAFANHNGGQLQFGADGMLYLGTGDGGGGGDPLGSGQNLDTLLGKILRLDVRTLPYRIPADNPFVGQPGRRPEIWAYGVRNPWRFAFDAATQSLYIADVGQNNREEVNVVAANAAGLDFGWNIWEGTMCYPTGNACSPAGVTMPVLDYDRGNGCSITGGYVYRGTALPEVAGATSIPTSATAGCGASSSSTAWRPSVSTGTSPPIGSIQSFGVDSRNELYALTSGGGVYKLVRD